MEIRNIVIIAHVDHGKTTLVDALLKQTHSFRDNQKEMSQELIMDSNELEKEKGITILAKNTSIFYKDTKINVIDTPGHADFGGEVERTINMASGAILLVDAAEGPLPQTKFVLKKALQTGLKIILVINKIDKKDARPEEVMNEVENLFLELADDDTSLEFVTLYAVGRDGKAFYKLPDTYTTDTKGDLIPLFDTIIREFPDVAKHKDKPLQMLISTLDYDNYVGRLCIGKVNQGSLKKDQSVALVDNNKTIGVYKVQKLYTTKGLNRVEVDEVSSGDIATIAGIPDLTIGQTVCDPAFPQSLPTIAVEEPTIKVTIGPNTSPFSGKEGKYSTSRQLRERLMKEIETNLGLRVEDDRDTAKFIVAGRGELHLAMLIEAMRREGYEMEVSKPQVIYKTIDGEICEPYEEVTIEVDDEFFGLITEEMGKRHASMLDMKKESSRTRIVYKIASQNLLGIRNSVLTKTRGTAQIHSYFLGYEPKGTKMEMLRNGALVAVKPGTAFNYSIGKIQDRGTLFIGHGTETYEGMVVGVANKSDDIEVNICKAKQLTNNRSSGEGVSVSIIPPTTLTLEQSLDFIADDELLEVTPLSLRIRKQWLSTTTRRVESRRLRDIRES
ncbi:GTP-binding protein TypA [Candidatus Roizmanbacteria bacterium RIFOXYB2_FULL_38_10]|uniref:50S ribosomal subunit assembly factor BipA n=1 Tax=Candidatus Roizmanbacteria bacterium RIFOXYD1_FULL_38_12 TaxID=1802093 RepID=A0A1F7L1L2_9BACT|nr:MAG: GTP-binding protein TypA [Candidatus Roizmanbacteria bacterium RIFOXYA2_FULL_38_14]OGK64010.1 MAG: GTP-binding protein TypA [Candidatus Roizmanbacteria bacterium RIFOXYA1_FULL_37_12]OGK65856.1 MAG: GTP-binding protein TypA [Candidatus Roizmanbacteria bacterium RIFOXYB1_FULL_40_23]OGK68963.1 MAG: GTP-binding protein TypA [Candidatus Roizmanbacteria bacterium RIFOXYB2_FULL_38_10]OGK70261.1 MAG: GTP-binding protein TypA [Candidatus Roizmanbacteria bacterium RIFOXYC1_FULL_38_14]OGK73056.1 